MILQEALRQADTQKLAAATYEYHRAADSGPTVYDERRCHGVTKAYSDFIQRLLTLSPKKEDAQCLLPDNDGPFMTAALYLYSDVRTALVQWQLERCYTKAELQHFSLAELKAIRQTQQQHQPDSYAYTFEPWENMLAVDICWPCDFSEDEKLQFLAAVLYEISFCGVTLEEHRRALAEMEAEWQAVKNAQTYPFDEFRREMGWDALPKRAATEKREDIINTILAIQQTFKMFQRVFTKAHYPAIFTKGPDGIHVTFPDLPGCITWGRDVPQAIEAAQTALTLHLSGMRQDKQSLPPATPVSLCQEWEQVKDDEAIYIIYEA